MSCRIAAAVGHLRHRLLSASTQLACLCDDDLSSAAPTAACAWLVLSQLTVRQTNNTAQPIPPSVLHRVAYSTWQVSFDSWVVSVGRLQGGVGGGVSVEA